MKHTCQVRRYLALASALALTAGLLIGCTRADTNSSQNTVSAGNTTGSNASGNVVAGAGGTGSADTSSGTAAQTDAQAAVTGTSSPAEAGTAQADGGAAPADTAQSTQSAQSVSGTAVQQTAPAPGTDADQAPEEIIYIDEAEEDADESFTGEFEKSDGTESVRIFLENDTAASFAFSVSGISASASVEGNTAVYYGDDGYSITFDVAGDTLAVSVGGDDADQSPVNGIYYRVLEGDDGDDPLYGSESAEDTADELEEAE